MKHRGLKIIEKSDDEIRESMWIEVIKQTEQMYAELAKSHTEIETKDRELRASKSFTENIIRSMKNVLIVSDAHGEIRIVNEAASRIFGYPQDELVGKKIEEILAPGEREKKVIQRSLYPHTASEGVLDMESVFVTRSGDRIPMTFSCSPLKDDDENIIGTVIVAQDLSNIKRLVNEADTAARAYRNKAIELERALTDLKQLQDHLIQSEKLAYLGKLAAGIAHEINNPLTTVLAITSFQLKKIAEDDPMLEDFQLIVEETKRCKKIVEELLEFSRQRAPEKSSTDVNQIVAESVSILAKQPFFHNIEIVRKFREQLPAAMVDRNQIKQVFMNMMLNAQEAMSDRGTLTVETALDRNREFIEIRFTDTGQGIHKDDIPRLFDPFFTTKNKAKGTGLGLSVSYGIITRHGGKIDVRSTPGRGSTFTVKIPVN